MSIVCQSWFLRSLVPSIAGAASVSFHGRGIEAYNYEAVDELIPFKELL